MGGERGQRDTAVHRSSEAWLTKVMFYRTESCRFRSF